MGEEGRTAQAARLQDKLAEVRSRIAPRFARREVRERAGRYLGALLEQGGRRNGRRMAERIGEGRPDGAQRLLNAARWDAGLVRDDLRGYVVERLSDPAAVLVLCEAGFPKKGVKSAGVARQRNPSTGRYENCQVGEFLAYASPRGRAFIDRALYLPEAWARNPGRLAAGGVPERIRYAPKGELALRMLERAFRAGVPASWVTGDEAFHDEDEKLLRRLEEWGRSYVLAVGRSADLSPVVEGMLARAPARDRWHSGADDGGRPRLWARAPLPRKAVGGKAWWTLVRRSAAEGPSKYVRYWAYGPEESTLAELARVTRTGEAVEEDLERARGEVGLDRYEVRRWEAWYRHVTLCLLAHAALEGTCGYKSRATGSSRGSGQQQPGSSRDGTRRHLAYEALAHS
jgi:SRSO17 transposase